MSETESQRHELPQPEFDGGSFTIDFLSDSLSGFEFQSREALRRRRGVYLNERQHLPAGGLPTYPLTGEQQEKIKAGMAREVAFSKRESGISEIDPHKLTDQQRERYLEEYRTTQKVGLRDVRQEGNLLTADTVQVPFPFYRNLNNPLEKPDNLELANDSATALILESKDGKLIVQHRGLKNALYKDIPGASVAGHFDKPKGPHQPGTLPEITTDSIRDNAKKEMQEEIGLNTEDIGEVRIAGLATDKVALHNEFLLFAKANLTAAEIEEKAKSAPAESLGHDFAENFFVIEGDADSIRKLLTDVKCPLPSTHTGAFVAAWYSQMLERMPADHAKLNLKLLEEDIKKNYQVIDMLVRAHDPESKGFDPAKAPQEQGLPDITSELKRTGLIQQPS